MISSDAGYEGAFTSPVHPALSAGPLDHVLTLRDASRGADISLITENQSLARDLEYLAP
jgi:hypothetical protein